MYIKSTTEHNALNNYRPQDRRNTTRRHLIYYLRAWDTDNNRLTGHVVDITTDGFMLISEESIPVGSEFQFEVQLPDAQGSLQPIRFRAICRWNSNDINKSFFDSGFEILEKNSESMRTIQGMINAYGFGG